VAESVGGVADSFSIKIVFALNSAGWGGREAGGMQGRFWMKSQTKCGKAKRCKPVF
jgi:hypothetical protein